MGNGFDTESRAIHRLSSQRIFELATSQIFLVDVGAKFTVALHVPDYASTPQIESLLVGITLASPFNAFYLADDPFSGHALPWILSWWASSLLHPSVLTC